MSTTSEAADVHGSSQPATSSSSLTHGTRMCNECESTECQAVFYCIACVSALCSPCDTKVVHTSKTTRNHKRMPIDEYLMIDRARGRYSPTDDEMVADLKNKFCFFSPMDHRIHLQPRLASLVKDPHAQPSLVAFIGPSGVGKSFLVRLLISLDGEEDAGDLPLAGAPNDADSTSADLHMYASRHKEYPLLYVDSEGRGGSKELRANLKMWNSLRPHFPSLGNDDTFPALRFKHVQVSYPRMLYIFSDVLCFVFSGDWRERESIVEPLLEWGKTAADGAANQHRPQLILIFNKAGKEASESEFDDFRKTYQKWVEGDKNSDTNLWRYYSDPLVVLIPQMEIDLPTVMKRVKELGKEILQSTTSIRESRNKVNQLFTRRELHLCMELSAETFSKNPEAPFDIYKASMAQRPNSGGLAGHIIQFHKAVCDENEKCESSGESFRISLSVLQKRIQWSLPLWINRVAGKVPIGANLPKDLRRNLELAQTTIDGKMPCRAVRKLDGKTYHCDSLRVTHGDQHCSGKERWDGVFTPLPEVQRAADNCRLVSLGGGALKCTMDVQEIRERLSKVRREEHENYPWLKSVIFYQVCVSCMVDVPTEVLSCGHIICVMCAKEEAEIREAKEKEEMHGTRKEDKTSSPKVELNLTCPVCLDSAKWYSKDLPPLAGYRILSLDGGGVRGIVELLSLQKIMSYFPGMHVEDLFDIIVGTSTGGIIALALTVHALDKKPKSLQVVIDLFENLCKEIFSNQMLRLGAKYELILRLFQLCRIYDSKYKNDALLRLLKEHLGEESLLRSCVGGPHVIATSCDLNDELAAAWFTSYNRLEGLEDESTDKESLDTGTSQPPKPLGRVSNNHVFSAADVAAATSAASTFFQPYGAAGRFWVDGGLRNNCPAKIAIQEARILWPTRKASALISLGCGQLDKRGLDPKLKSSFSLLKIAGLMVDIVTDAENQWNEAIGWLNQIQPGCGFRLSPPILLPKGEDCELDCADKLPFLKEQTMKYLDSEHGRGYVENAANLLFAALFYLHVETNQDTQQPDLDKLCIRSRSTLPRNLKDALIAATSLSGQPPFSVTFIPPVIGAKPQFLKACTWHQDVLNLPFRLCGFPLMAPSTQLKVTVELLMCLPGTNRKFPLPISGMPWSLGAEN